ncbi:MAG TPA: hypothetical protein VEQ59_16950, partial [Polyangiaceae bacterium]|nr:hypothetical protein [Polyangiaceae bacterium]
MSARDPREARLRRLLREARAGDPVDLDWTRVEERLLREARHAAPPLPSRSTYGLAWVALAAAAAVALWLVGSRGADPAARARPPLVAADASLRRDGDQLPLGARVVAEARSVSVEHAGRARWSLAPTSSALLTERAERISVRLERGSVLSEVVPSAKPETFVIEAAG